MKRFLVAAGLLIFISPAQSQEPATKKSRLYTKEALAGPVEYLWPEGTPGSVGDSAEDKPSLTLFPAPGDRVKSAAVVVCPGGGYGWLAVGHEGKEVADWFNKRGVHAFVLRYRLGPRYAHPAMMNDVNRAVRMVRARAAEWKVDPGRIGVMGFSAGGHLASTAVTHFDDGKPDAQDPIERVSCRPDFGVLVYPVVALGEAHTHKGSQKNLLGKNFENPEFVKLLSNEKQITAKTPPCFLIHTSTDRVVPPENSVYFYLALRKAKVSAELHVFEKGPHGFGLATDPKKYPVLSRWPARLDAWLRLRGILGE